MKTTTTTTADAIRKITALVQTEIESGHRSAAIDAHDITEILLAIADELAPADSLGVEAAPADDDRDELEPDDGADAQADELQTAIVEAVDPQTNTDIFCRDVARLIQSHRPEFGISFGYIGNIDGGRDDRAWYFFTQVEKPGRDRAFGRFKFGGYSTDSIGTLAARVRSGDLVNWLTTVVAPHAPTIVPESHKCPGCGERRTELLVWDELGESLTCSNCETNYYPEG